MSARSKKGRLTTSSRGEKVSDGLSYVRRRRLKQAVFVQFFTQRVAVDAKNGRSSRLVAAALRHHGFQHRFFHLAQHHVVNVAGGFAVQRAEVLVKVLLDTVGNIGNFVGLA